MNRTQKITRSFHDYFPDKNSSKQNKSIENVNRLIAKHRDRSQPNSLVRSKKGIEGRRPQLRHMNLTLRSQQENNPLITASWNGKTNKFTNSFHNQMYQDTRINSMRLKFRREKMRKINLEK